MFAACPLPEEGGRTGLQLRREAAARRSVPKNSASSGKAHLPGEEHSECVGTPAKPPFTGGNDKWRVLPVAVTAVYNGTERL